MKIERPIIALDFPDREACRNFLKKFPEEEKLFVKIGMELYYSEGQDMVKEIMDLGHDVFLPRHSAYGRISNARAWKTRRFIDDLARKWRQRNDESCKKRFVGRCSKQWQKSSETFGDYAIDIDES